MLMQIKNEPEALNIFSLPEHHLPPQKKEIFFLLVK